MTPGDIDEAREPGSHWYRVLICDLCIAGEGGVCHIPACAFFLKAAPDVPMAPQVHSMVERLPDATTARITIGDRTSPLQAEYRPLLEDGRVLCLTYEEQAQALADRLNALRATTLRAEAAEAEFCALHNPRQRSSVAGPCWDCYLRAVLSESARITADRDAARAVVAELEAALRDIVSDCGVMAERNPGGAEDDFHALWKTADTALRRAAALRDGKGEG